MLTLNETQIKGEYIIELIYKYNLFEDEAKRLLDRVEASMKDVKEILDQSGDYPFYVYKDLYDNLFVEQLSIIMSERCPDNEFTEDNWKDVE